MIGVWIPKYFAIFWFESNWIKVNIASHNGLVPCIGNGSLPISMMTKVDNSIKCPSASITLRVLEISAKWLAIYALRKATDTKIEILSHWLHYWQGRHSRLAIKQPSRLPLIILIVNTFLCQRLIITSLAPWAHHPPQWLTQGNPPLHLVQNITWISRCQYRSPFTDPHGLGPFPIMLKLKE